MRRHEWRAATVESIAPACIDMVTLRLRPDESIPHHAGQHYEIRFPGELPSRKFSIASSSIDEDALEFGIQVRPKGMITPRLATCEPGAQLEVRGPTGAAFAWRPEDDGPLILIGGGAGITPLASISETYARSTAGRRGSGSLLFLYTARSPERVYRLERYGGIMSIRYSSTEGRYTRKSLAAAIPSEFRSPRARVRICGPSSFMKLAVECVLELGLDPERVRAEAFV